MKKVLIIILDNNKGKYISKGFSESFKILSYFTIEKKICDLNEEEIKFIKPDILFSFWTDIKENNILINLINNINNCKIIHCAENLKDIPSEFHKKANNYCFSLDNKSKKYQYIQSIFPQDYRTKFSGYRYTVTFAGNPAYENREKLLSKIIYNFGKINIFCRSFDFYKSIDDIYNKNFLNEKYIELYKESYKGYVENQKELSEIYASSKVNIDIENINKKSINYRCLEILASGGFLIAPYNTKIIKLFEEGKEFESYKSFTELEDKIKFYIKNLNIAQMIATKGKTNAVSNYTIYDKLKLMIKEVYDNNSNNR